MNYDYKNAVQVNGDGNQLYNTLRYYNNSLNNALSLVGSNDDNGQVNVIGTLNKHSEGIVKIIPNNETDTGSVLIGNQNVDIRLYGTLYINDVKVNQGSRDTQSRGYLYNIKAQLLPNQIWSPAVGLDYQQYYIKNIAVKSSFSGMISIGNNQYSYTPSNTFVIIDTDYLDMSTNITSTSNCEIILYIFR